MHPTESFCFNVKLSLWIVGMGIAMTAKSETMFITACAKATFSKQLVVPDFKGLHGPPVMLVKVKV